MKKILIVFGTRPEAIKMIPLIKKLKLYSDIFDTRVCFTGQHKEMVQSLLEIFSIEPDYNLNIMKKNQDLYDITANLMFALKDILQEFKADYLFVHGDTTTTMVSSLVSYYEKLSLCHVEAGLRTNNIYSPWPEEINRQITARIAQYHFAPTETAKNNLLSENIKEDNIVVTGNTVIDMLMLAEQKIKRNSTLVKDIIAKLEKLKIDIVNKKLILVTGHRRENFGSNFLNICNAIKSLAISNENINIIYPVHLNPNVQEPVKKILSNIENVYLIEPLDYLEFVFLMTKSYLILTDSGGIQEEAPSLGKPVLVMRDTTERPEAVESGTIKLVGTDKDNIIEEIQCLLNNDIEYKKMSTSKNPYGDGNASQKIVDFLREKK